MDIRPGGLEDGRLERNQGRPEATAEPRHGEIRRFGLSTRWVHRTTAFVFGICIATAAVLYLPQLSILVGRRALVVTIHFYSGLTLPVPALLGWLLSPHRWWREDVGETRARRLLGRFGQSTRGNDETARGRRPTSGHSGGFRRDAAELNRFGPADSAWLREHLLAGPARRLRRRSWASSAGGMTTGVVPAPGAPDAGQTRLGGKFNAGQKLYAAGVAGSIVVFLGTGLLMWFGADLDVPDRYRTGATFVHDVFAYGIFFAICGHLWMASRDPFSRAGMRTGYVPTWWAAAEHPDWDTGTDRDTKTDRDTETDPASPDWRTGRPSQ
ncbi:formate dehydrogenase [Pseudofrankia sp. BMG5.37]|uniref:formate dehydrogenase n=1 Tax=Pseudofrankia sp. BMG5.37 TaxID=3050035 RepID=UPI00289465D9|nr:formate dehydrogenase [Pseudofrankia sp. BMG5.37]MDT3439684.1 formate dehydrogenase [Pseudofrankia sp. BMG5.37]